MDYPVALGRKGRTYTLATTPTHTPTDVVAVVAAAALSSVAAAPTRLIGQQTPRAPCWGPLLGAPHVISLGCVLEGASFEMNGNGFR